MKLAAFVAENRDEIAREWFETAVSVYPEGMQTLVCGDKSSFSNPCGQNLSSDIDRFLRAVEKNESANELAARLTITVKIRSVQNISPSTALSFVPGLKNVLRDCYQKRHHRDVPLETYLEWSAVIDGATLAALDLYTEQRTRIAEVCIGDVKRRISGIMSRLGWDAP